MQRARLAVQPQPVPVEDPVCRVAVLLDLHDQIPRADRVDAPARDEHRLPAVRRQRVDQLRHAAFRERPLEVPARHPPLQPRVEVAVQQRIEQIPHLRLRLAAQPRRHRRGRMHLHREPVLRIEDLAQQRKARQLRQPRAEHLRAMLRPQLIQRAAAQRPLMHYALRILAIHQLPGFPDARGVRQTFAQQRLQAASAPDALHEERLEDERLVHLGSKI